jgi:hypothetical protein
VTAIYPSRHELPDAKGPSLEMFRVLCIDRTSLPPGVSDKDVSDRSAYKYRTKIRRSASQLWTVLGQDRPGLSLDDIVNAADRLFSDLDSMPLSRLYLHVVEGLLKEIPAEDLSSKRFAKRYGSLIWDLAHLTGAIYCDIFTCDYRIDRAIGNFRTARGMRRQVSVRGQGGSREFVAELTRQLGFDTM